MTDPRSPISTEHGFRNPAGSVAAPPQSGYRPETDAGRASRRWRSVWRFHFYAGMLSMPSLVLFALTGLVILYTQPVQDLLQGNRRTVAASGCLLIFWMAFTALVMWWKRRPKGKPGLPRRPADTSVPAPLLLGIGLVAVVYPLWGVSAILILLIDRLVIRRVPKLRATFGMS